MDSNRGVVEIRVRHHVEVRRLDEQVDGEQFTGPQIREMFHNLRIDSVLGYTAFADEVAFGMFRGDILIIDVVCGLEDKAVGGGRYQTAEEVFEAVGRVRYIYGNFFSVFS